MTEPGDRLWGTLAAAWVVLVLAVIGHQIVFWRGANLDSDVMALLPGEKRDPLLQQAEQGITDYATRQIVVVLGTAHWEDVRRAVNAYRTSLARSNVGLVPVTTDPAAMEAAVEMYRPHRSALLTPAQRTRLRETKPEALADAALARLFAPGPSGGLTRWQDDPLGLWPEWWRERMGQGLSLRDGLPTLTRDNLEWAALQFEYSRSAFRLDGERRLLDALDAAAKAAYEVVPGPMKVMHGGVPLHAEAAAVQASREVNTIGWGSLLAVILLTWAAFRSPRPILLVAASLLIGVAAGVSATALLFGNVHVLTLVFGASLVGVAEDYGIHYFASRQGHPELAPRPLLRRLLPSMVLAFVTSVLAYLALGAAPFPGLRQMAVFSAVGLGAAFLTVVLWYPWLDRAAPVPSRFGQRIASSLHRWPRLSGVRGFACTGLLILFALVGLLRLTPDDSVRSLRSSPPELIAQERAIGELLGLPSPAQFYVVEGESEEQVLRREEILTARLRDEVARGRLRGWRAISDWLPSQRRQRADAALSGNAERLALGRATEWLGGDADDSLKLAPTPLSLTTLLEQPIAASLRPLWLGAKDARYGSVVMLDGVGAHTDLFALRQIAPKGARFVDRTDTMSQLLGQYRAQMSWLLLFGYVAVAVALFVRYRFAAWRALFPTLLAAALSLGLLGWIGEPLQLFAVLAQLLLLGIGTDYGVFLLEHPDDPSSWLAISVGAASTLLAFGLLGLSATPALHSFGLTLLFGLSLAWILTPCFRPASRH